MNLLKQYRVAKGLTCEKLGKRVGVSRSAVSNWELGKRLPVPCTYPKLARVLGMDPRELARIIEPSEPYPGHVAVQQPA